MPHHYLLLIGDLSVKTISIVSGKARDSVPQSMAFYSEINRLRLEGIADERSVIDDLDLDSVSGVMKCFEHSNRDYVEEFFESLEIQCIGGGGGGSTEEENVSVVVNQVVAINVNAMVNVDAVAMGSPGTSPGGGGK